jgi:hypothetical protein
VRQQVEGDLVPAAGEQHQDALGLLDGGAAGHRGAQLPHLGLERLGPLQVGPVRAALRDVDAHAFDGGDLPRGVPLRFPDQDHGPGPTVRADEPGLEGEGVTVRAGPRQSLEDAGAVLRVLAPRVFPGGRLRGRGREAVEGEHLR